VIRPGFETLGTGLDVRSSQGEVESTPPPDEKANQVFFSPSPFTDHPALSSQVEVVWMLHDSVSDLALTVANDPQASDLAAHLGTVTFRELGAHVVTMYVRVESEEAPHLLLVAHWGLTLEEESKYTLIQEDFPLPASDAIRHLLPMAMSMEQLAERYPLLGIRPDFTDGSQLFLPIVLDATPVAAVLVACRHGFRWDPDTWRAIHAIQALLGIYMRVTDRVWLPARPLSPDLTERQGLSRRQISVLTLLERGRTIPAIAARLVFSESTIKQDLRRAARLLGTRDRRSTIARAADLGLLQSSPDDQTLT